MMIHDDDDDMMILTMMMMKVLYIAMCQECKFLACKNICKLCCFFFKFCVFHLRDDHDDDDDDDDADDMMMTLMMI